MSLQHVRELVSEVELTCWKGGCIAAPLWLCVRLDDPVAALCACDAHRGQLARQEFAITRLDHVRGDVELWASLHGAGAADVLGALRLLLAFLGRKAAR